MIKVLKPAMGLMVRMQSRELLAEKGQMIIMNTFWWRRIRDGDVVEVKSSEK